MALLTFIKAAFRQRDKIHAAALPRRESSFHIEALESRVLLSGDFFPQAGLIPVMENQPAAASVAIVQFLDSNSKLSVDLHGSKQSGEGERAENKSRIANVSGWSIEKVQGRDAVDEHNAIHDRTSDEVSVAALNGKRPDGQNSRTGPGFQAAPREQLSSAPSQDRRFTSGNLVSGADAKIDTDRCAGPIFAQQRIETLRAANAPPFQAFQNSATNHCTFLFTHSPTLNVSGRAVEVFLPSAAVELVTKQRILTLRGETPPDRDLRLEIQSSQTDPEFKGETVRIINASSKRVV